MMINDDIEIKDFIINNVKGKTCSELANLVNNKFGLSYDDKKIKYYKRKYNLTSGVDTKFKKGGTPHNVKNNGHEFVTTDGYSYIKVNNKFIKKQRYLYEKYYGKIPKGYDIMFLDSNKSNFDIDNLYLVKHKDLLIAKNFNLCTTDKELTKTGLLVASVINRTCERRKEIKKVSDK